MKEKAIHHRHISSLRYLFYVDALKLSDIFRQSIVIDDFLQKRKK